MAWLTPEWTYATGKTTIRIAQPLGAGLNPLDVSSAEDRLRLRSYFWPDQTNRVARMDSALNLARIYPTTIEKVDSIECLARQLGNLVEG